MNNLDLAAKLIVLRREFDDVSARLNNLIREVLDTEEVEE